MAQPTDSFKQFDYSLRPSKQVERKIMIEVLLRLSKAKYNISDYAYLGFGSPFYIDFVIFHKYLFIDEMVCVEWSDVKRRMRFNKPFNFIKLRLCSFANYIPDMRKTKESLLWLDYDRALDDEMLRDIDGALNRMAPKSILIITIDARPRLPKDRFESDLDAMGSEERETLTAETYQEWFGRYTDTAITREAISRNHVAPLFYEVVIERIRQTVTRLQDGLRFIQLFNYVYKDGAPMMTVGGMIGTNEDHQALRKAGIFKHRFVRTKDKHLEISVPPLTIRERYWLDRRLDSQVKNNKGGFELEKRLLENYRRFYRQYPTYLETLL